MLKNTATLRCRKVHSLTNDVDSIFEDSSIQIIVEVMGGVTFARDCVEKALKAKKSVVTANKDLLAEAGPYLLDLAGKNGVDLRYEASVLGGIPIIRTLYESLGGNKITEIVGILNGTTNFILSNMTEKGAGYAEVLAEAQALATPKQIRQPTWKGSTRLVNWLFYHLLPLTVVYSLKTYP